MNRPLLDSLEMRRLLASITLNEGNVKIDGTTGNDEIVIRKTQDGRISLNLNDEEKKIGVSKLKSISVKSWAGDDSINVHYNLIIGTNLERRLDLIPFSLNSGKGKDSVEIYTLKPVKVSLGDGNDQLTSYVQSTVYGGSGNDEIRVFEPLGVWAQVLPPGTEETLSQFNSLVYGNDGNDVLHMIGGQTFGGRGNDVITGAGNLHGEGGNDQITLEYGMAFGGDDNDTLKSTDDDLFFNGLYASRSESEIDSTPISVQGLRASSIPVTPTNYRTQMLDGGDGNDNLSAGENAALLGGAGDDLLTYRGVEWTMNQPRGNRFGGSGNDRIVVESGWEFLDSTFGVRTSGDAGNDYIEGRRVEGGSGNDTLVGTEHGDLLEGGEGDDQLFGGAGTDTLQGDAGNDRLYGGWLLLPSRYIANTNDLGRDIATGGAGSDFFQFNYTFGSTDKTHDDRLA